MKKANILVVDDDVALAEGIADVLDAKGYKVSVANDGFVALDMVKKGTFNIVLMDIKMPGINGVETYKRIKDVRPEIKAVLMTAYSTEDLVEEAIHEGVSQVLDKPVDLDALVAVVEALAGKTRVMVVDDDPAFCESIKDVLENKGFKVRTAGDYAEAMSLVQNDPIDLFLIDIKLPTRNGLETYLALREIDPKASYIMITGYIEEMCELAKKATESGAYTCLYKPLDIDKLEECMGGALAANGKATRVEIGNKDGGKTNILVVDDDEILCQVLADLLELKKGYSVSVAVTGMEALDKAGKNSYKAALLDFTLPDMNGLDLLVQIRKISPETRCIVLTGRSAEEVASRAPDKGVFAYLTKPSSAEEIINTIEGALGK